MASRLIHDHVVWEGDTAPDLTGASSLTPGVFWRDTSGETVVLKQRNKANTAWVAVDTDTYVDAAVVAKLAALDAAGTALSAINADLDETIAKADLDDAGVIDGTEIAALFSALHTRVNDLTENVNAIVAALTGINT